MSPGKKAAIGLLSIVPFVAMCVMVYGFVEDDPVALYVGLIVSGLVDTGLAPVFIPHVYDNQRIGKDWKILWIALLGIPYITVAPVYWLLHVLPEKPRPPEPEGPQKGAAWYADPWGQAPFRWWDGQRWTDWVTGPPGGA